MNIPNTPTSTQVGNFPLPGGVGGATATEETPSPFRTQMSDVLDDGEAGEDGTGAGAAADAAAEPS